MTYQELNQYILHYLTEDKTKSAIMLTGPWGTGKSYYIQNELKPFLEKKENGGHSCVIVSLYGLKDTAEISKSIYLGTRMKFLTAASEKSTTVTFAGETIIKGIAGALGVDLSVSERSLKRLYASVNLTGKLVVLEDLERSGIDILEVLGYVNNLVEQDGVKVLLVANEEELIQYTPLKASTKADLERTEMLDRLNGHKDRLFTDGTLAYLKVKEKTISDNIAYSQREFSYDNSLMELVRHTIEFIKRKPYGNKLLIKVKDEVKLVIDATSKYEPCDRQKIIEQNKKNTVRHAYFREYLALQRLCLLILQHQKHQIGMGVRQIYGILFDGAWLWEEYINSLIEDVFYHPMNKGGKGAQRLFAGNVGLIYPDFISRNSEMRIIADAKYKPIDNIGNRDYLQVLAYMFRFEAKAGYYLYPEAEDSDDLKLWLNRGLTYEKNVMARDDISVTKHGLKIPVDALNYNEFSARIKTCEQEFKSALIF